MYMLYAEIEFKFPNPYRFTTSMETNRVVIKFMLRFT